MAQNTIGFMAAAVGTGVLAKAVELPTPFAGLAAAAVFAVCMGVSSVLKVDVPKPQAKAKKMSKKEKRAKAAAAEAPAIAVLEAAEEEKLAAKAAKKRVKEQARKQAKRAAAVQEKEAVEQEKVEAEAAVVTEKKMTKDQKKKQKQKEKAKAKKAAASGGKAEQKETAAPAAAAPAAVKEEEDEENTDWEEVKVKKVKKKEEIEIVGDATDAFMLSFYVERKHFRVIIGSGGANLRAIIDATGTQIELPKEGGIQMETIITGPQAGCLRAQAAIQQLMTKGYCDLTHAGTVDTAVAVPEARRGTVIGVKGANIRILQEKLNVKINFPERGSEDDVQIVGDPKAVKEAAAAIKSLVEKGFSSLTHENFTSSGVEVPRSMLKNLIGTGGATIKALQTSTNVKINVPSEKSGDMVSVSLTGEPEAIADCRAQILALMVAPEPTPIDPEWQQQASLQHLDLW